MGALRMSPRRVTADRCCGCSDGGVDADDVVEATACARGSSNHGCLPLAASVILRRLLIFRREALGGCARCGAGLSANLPLLAAPSQGLSCMPATTGRNVHQRPDRKPKPVHAAVAVGAPAVACAVVWPLGAGATSHRLRPDRRGRRAGGGRRDDPPGPHSTRVEIAASMELAQLLVGEAVGLMQQEVPAEKFLTDLSSHCGSCATYGSW